MDITYLFLLIEYKTFLRESKSSQPIQSEILKAPIYDWVFSKAFLNQKNEKYLL